MKRKKIFLYSIVSCSIIILILSMIHSYRYNGASLKSRENILSKSYKEATILSETVIENYIICEIVNQRQRYGYALFRPEGKNRYRFDSSMVVDNGNIGVDFIWIDEKKYELFMCDQPNLEYVKVIYTDMSNLKITTKQLGLLNGKMAIVEALDCKDYRTDVSFYDVSGNKYQ